MCATQYDGSGTKATLIDVKHLKRKQTAAAAASVVVVAAAASTTTAAEAKNAKSRPT